MLLKKIERIERVQHLVYAGNYWLLSGVSIHSPDDWWLELQAGSAAGPIKTELCLLGRCWTSDINNPDQYQDVPRISTAASQEAQPSPLYSVS